MSEQKEIEFKNLLTESEFIRLLTTFNIHETDFHQQTNYYFETENFSLKALQMALRVRQKNDQYELTLKQPALDQIGLLETNQPITSEQAMSFINHCEVPSGEVAGKLQTISPSMNFTCFGKLDTERAEIEYQNGILVFDKSRYLNSEDFELEYEVSDFDKGKATFEALLDTLQIPSRKTKNKVQRLSERLNM